MGTWYRTGTVAVTNGSATVVGTGTLWASQASVGDIFIGPDLAEYEITAVTDDTHISVKKYNGTAAYNGSTLSAQAYAIIRNFTSTLPAQLASDLAALQAKYHVTLDDLVAWLNGTGSINVHDAVGNSHSLQTPAALLAAQAGRLPNKSVAGNTNVTLSAAEASNLVIELTGALTGDIIVYIPPVVGQKLVFNNTTGAHALTFAATGASGVIIEQGARAVVECDGTNILSPISDISGRLILGLASTAGETLVRGRYVGATNYLQTISTQYSTGGLCIGYGVESRVGAAGFKSTTNSNLGRCGFSVDNGGFAFSGAGAQTTAYGSTVTMTSLLTGTVDGVVTVPGTFITTTQASVNVASGANALLSLAQASNATWNIYNAATTGDLHIDEAGVLNWLKIAKTTGTVTIAGNQILSGITFFGAEGRVQQNGVGIDILPASGRQFRVVNNANTQERFTVSESTGNTFVYGSLGVGIAASYGLHLQRSAASDYAAYINNTSATSPKGLAIGVTGVSGDTTGYALSVADSVAVRFKVGNDGATYNNNGAVGTVSDERLKQDIVDAKSQWEDIKAMRVRKFRLKSNPTGPLQIGFIAQELQKTSPGLIDELPEELMFDVPAVMGTRSVPVSETINEDGEKVIKYADEEYEVQSAHKVLRNTGETHLAVKTSIIHLKAVKALQEAMLRIEALEGRLAALEAK